MTALSVPELEVPEALAAVEELVVLDVLAALAACAVVAALFAAAVVVVVVVPVPPAAVFVWDVVVAVPSPLLLRAAVRTGVVLVAAVLVPRLPSPYTAPHESTRTVRAIAPTRRRMTRTRRARARRRRRSSADWGRLWLGVFEVMGAVCGPPLTAPCASPESRLSQRESVRCSIFRPRAMITSLVSAGGKIPCPTTPGAASRRAASASGSANAVR